MMNQRRRTQKPIVNNISDKINKVNQSKMINIIGLGNRGSQVLRTAYKGQQTVKSSIIAHETPRQKIEAYNLDLPGLNDDGQQKPQTQRSERRKDIKKSNMGDGIMRINYTSRNPHEFSEINNSMNTSQTKSPYRKSSVGGSNEKNEV